MCASLQGCLHFPCTASIVLESLWLLQFPICRWAFTRGRFPSLLLRGSVEGGGVGVAPGDASCKQSHFIQLLDLQCPVCWTSPSKAGARPGSVFPSCWAGCGQCCTFLCGRGKGRGGSHSVQCKYSLRTAGQDLLCKHLVTPHMQTPAVLYHSPDYYGLLQSFLNDLFCVVWPLAKQAFSLVLL